MLTDQASKYSVIWRAAAASGAATTLTLWTPSTSTKVVVTGFDVANSTGVSGTLAIYFSNSNTSGAPKTIAIYTLESSTSINPRFPGVEGPMDIDVRAVSGVGGGAWYITAYGFELP